MTPLASDSAMKRTIRARFDKNLSGLFGDLDEEVRFAIHKEVPHSSNWMKVNLNKVMKRIVARVISRVQLGLPLCRDEAWLHASILYTESTMTTVAILRLFPSYLHPLVYVFLPSRWHARYSIELGETLVKPIIAQRRNALNGSRPQKASTLVETMMEDREMPSSSELVKGVLDSGRAAIHTTAMAACNTLYDIHADDDSAHTLREEVVQSIEKTNGFNHATLQELRKMDSYMKESMRLNQPLMRRRPLDSRQN